MKFGRRAGLLLLALALVFGLGAWWCWQHGFGNGVVQQGHRIDIRDLARRCGCTDQRLEPVNLGLQFQAILHPLQRAQGDLGLPIADSGGDTVEQVQHADRRTQSAVGQPDRIASRGSPVAILERVDLQQPEQSDQGLQGGGKRG